MTSNLSLDQINDLLSRAAEKDENIRIIQSIGIKLEFLDVFVENSHGQLKTSVFHKPAAEPYIYPIHRNIHVIFTVIQSKELCSEPSVSVLMYKILTMNDYILN